MTPTLLGRIQTRWLLLLLVGVPWTVVICPLLLPFAGGAGLGAVYELAFVSLAIVGVVGTAWEVGYHLLMQLRWEKDWPALFGLVTAVNEFATLILVLALFGYQLSFAVVLLFASVWLWMWFVANGPLRVLFVHWRYRGGRVV
ncbi:hypothetical protein [Mycolicibacterium hippocampi]|uniref:hypothetical protein n=1 Tax=Mycolicibacterium hippocampi TaxID=659824 RepID=UPI003512DF95